MPNFQRRERHLANWWRHPIKKRSQKFFNCFVLGFLNFWSTPHSFRCFVGLEINWWQVFTMDPNHMIGPFGHPCRSQHTQTTDLCYRGDLATKVLKRRERRSPKVGTQNPVCFLLKQKNIRFVCVFFSPSYRVQFFEKFGELFYTFLFFFWGAFLSGTTEVFVASPRGATGQRNYRCSAGEDAMHCQGYAWSWAWTPKEKPLSFLGFGGATKIIGMT